MNPRWERAAALLLVGGLLIGGALLLFPLRHQQPEPRVERPAGAPVLDFADPDTRDLLMALQQENETLFDRDWLGERCGRPRLESGAEPNTLVLTRYTFPTFDIRRYRVRFGSAGGQLFVDERSVGSRPQPTPHGRLVAVDAAAVEAMEFRLRQGGFYRMPIEARVNVGCGTETVSLETCVAGRYFAARRCGTEGALGKLADSLEHQLRAKAGLTTPTVPGGR